MERRTCPSRECCPLTRVQEIRPCTLDFLLIMEQLRSASIRDELMDFIYNYPAEGIQIRAKSSPDQNCLKRLGSCNQDVGRMKCLRPSYFLRRVAMSYFD